MDPIGEAYVGPATLKLRKDVPLEAPVATTVSHGERVLILQRRRRFLRVRASNGVEGWTEMRQLLAAEQMKGLDKLAERAAKMTSQGRATVYEPVNVHTDPNRYSPSFYQVKENEQIDVIQHLVTERIPFKGKDVLPPPTPKKRKPKKKEEDDPKRVRPPAPPPAPQPPANWLELSKTPPEYQDLKDEEEPPKPTPKDDWTLVRMKNGRAGYVLTRMLKMNIPDEVAQYSEGQRITSYFDMATVQDGDQTRHHWLWTTNSQNAVPWQFDSFRYFIWNTRRHRYETSYIERNMRGYLPVEVHPVTVVMNKTPQTVKGFSLLVEEEDGQLYKKTYAYQIYLVKLVEKTKVAMDQPAAPSQGDNSSLIRLASGKAVQVPSSVEKPSLFARMKENVLALRRKWFGK